MNKETKEKVQAECARLVWDYLETPEGAEGAAPAKVAELRLQALLRFKVRLEDYSQ